MSATRRANAAASAVGSLAPPCCLIVAPIAARPHCASARPGPRRRRRSAVEPRRCRRQPAAAAAAADPITMSLVSTDPDRPAGAGRPTPTVTVVVSITNNTDNALQQVQLRGVRDSPIIRQSALDDDARPPGPPADASLTQSLVDDEVHRDDRGAFLGSS